MDSTEFNKIAGGVIGALLLFMLLHFASGKIYGTSAVHHGDEPLAFALEIEEAGEVETAEPAAVDYSALVASADVGDGESTFKKCRSCHKLEDGVHANGPSLWGVVGRDIAVAAGFSYSDALTGLEGDWTLTELSAFLEDPKGYAPGTKMVFKGIDDPQERVNLIAYLNEADGTPIELAAAAPASDAAPAAAPAAADEGAPKEDTAATDGGAASDDAAAKEEPAPATETTEAPEASTDSAASESTETDTEVAVKDEPASGESAPATGATSAAFSGGDAAAGEKVFRKCKACHKVEEGKDGVGPNLWGIVGRDIAAVDGFNYSPALVDMEGTWTATTLSEFLADPKGFAPGTKMTLSGLKKDVDRINVITYLNEADGSPEPLE